MNPINTAILLTLLPSLSLAQAPIKKVVVFADRAEVTRSRTVPCEKGQAQAVFTHLPITLEERTLRAEATGKGKVIGTTSETAIHEIETDERVAELEKELKKVRAEIQQQTDLSIRLGQQDRSLVRYARVFNSILNESVRNPRPDTKNWGATLDTFRARQMKTAEQRASVQTKLRNLRATELKLVRRIQRFGVAGKTKKDRKADVAVQCNGQKSVGVSLSYVVPGATWHPEYDLRFTPNKGRKVGAGRAELTVAGVVQQSTGEDWRDVELYLSTAKPKLGAAAPEPAALFVEGSKKDEGKVLVEAREERTSLQRGEESKTRAPTSVALEDKGQAVVMQLPHKVSVVSDGRPYWMPIDRVRTKGTSKLVSIPKLRERVFVVVSLKNPAPYPLLAGRVHGYRKDSYVGDSQLSYRGLGEPMEVSLGIDEEIKISRKELKTVNWDSSVFGSSKELMRSYRIRVTNRAKGRQKIEVRENIPVSKIEDVEAELLKDKTTQGYALDKHRGFIVWSVNLASGAERAVDIAYAVRIPEDWKVR